MTDFPVTLTVRVYRRLLGLLLPSRFRARYAQKTLMVFAEMDAAARERGGAARAWRALAAEAVTLLRVSAQERRAERASAHHGAKASDDPAVARTGHTAESLYQDVKYAVRALRRSPVFALIAILTLALGVGANSAVFSVVDGVLLRPLDVEEPERVFVVGEASTSDPDRLSVTSPANLYDWQRSTTKLRIAGLSVSSGTVTGRGEPQLLDGRTSIAGLFDVLGLRPFLGRPLTVADEDPLSPMVIVLGYETWQALFGADPGALGQTLTMNGTPRTVVGVMPAGFTFFGSVPAFFVPARFDAAFRENRDQGFIRVVGRLMPDATIGQARAELDVIAARLRRDWPLYNGNLLIRTQPLHEFVVGGVRTQLLVLMGAVGFVLLITCANLGNLLLARGHARRREMAVRRALGAGQGRIVRQLMTEGLLLALLGGAVGLLVARLFLSLLMAAEAATNLPRAGEVALDVRVLAFTLGVSVIAGLLFGSAPAWQLARAGSGRGSDPLREGARGGSGATFARSVLVVAEIGLAMMLLIGAGLLLRSFDLLAQVDPGIRAERVLTFDVRRPSSDSSFFPASVERIRALPGVRSAALTSQLPVSGPGIAAGFDRVDRPLTDAAAEAYRVVTPGYFETVGIPLTRGRLLEPTDRADAPVVVVNETLARRYFPDEDPIGRAIRMGAPDNWLFERGTIVGVVADTRDAGLGSDPLPTVYIPLALMPTWPSMSFVVRTSAEPTAVAAAARAIIREMDAALPVRNVRSMDRVLATAVAPARWSSTLLATFAGIALVIAVLGVTGVLSFVVSQRTRELGIRMALGATPGRVRWFVVARGLAMTVPGLAVGALGALWLTRFMRSLLFGVSPIDPLTWAAVPAILLIAAALACYLPARRATRVHPMAALRAD